MRQVTLIALYGNKPALLSELISECQKQITEKISINFKPYTIRQIHATIIGLEQVEGSAWLNLNFDKHRNRKERMNFEGLLSLIRAGNTFPLQVQIGGFRNRDYPFVSRGQRPYERSFSIQGDKAVLMGWPIRGTPSASNVESKTELIQESRIYPTALDDIRRASQSYNVLHSYHRSLTDIDNDFYFRIGLIKNTPLDPLLQQIIENTMKQFLSIIRPVIIEVTLQDVYIASYENDTLPLKTTKIWPVSDGNITANFIENLYK